MRAAKPSPLPPPLLPPLSAARARSPPSLSLGPGNPPPPPSARAPARLPRSSFLLPSRTRVTLATAVLPHLNCAPASHRSDPPSTSVRSPVPLLLGVGGVALSPRSISRPPPPHPADTDPPPRRGLGRPPPGQCGQASPPRSQRAPRRALWWESARCSRLAALTDLPRPPGRAGPEPGASPARRPARGPRPPLPPSGRIAPRRRAA